MMSFSLWGLKTITIYHLQNIDPFLERPSKLFVGEFYAKLSYKIVKKIHPTDINRQAKNCFNYCFWQSL